MSTTSSTVKPMVFCPPAIWRSTVVPPSVRAAGSGCPRAFQPSTTVTRVPRTLTRPATTGGAPGMRVVSNRGRISRTTSAAAAQVRPPTRNTSSRTTCASPIGCEEAKILQGVGFSKQVGIGGRCDQRGAQVRRPFRLQREPLARNRMREREGRRVQELPRRERLEPLRVAPLRRRHAATAAEGVLAVADDGVADLAQVHTDLMRASRAERDAQQVGLGEVRDDGHVADRVAPARLHGHALAVLGVAVDRRGDLHGALGKVSPRERRVAALDAPLLDGTREAAVRDIGLGDEQQPRRVLVEAMHDAGPALARRAPPPLHSGGPRPPSTLTSVSSQWPGPGCTTRPAGLSSTARCSSSYTKRTPAPACGGVTGEYVRGGASGGSSTLTSAPRSSSAEARRRRPAAVTRLSAMRRAAWVRERASWSARKRSRRSVAGTATQKTIREGARVAARVTARPSRPPSRVRAPAPRATGRWRARRRPR